MVLSLPWLSSLFEIKFYTSFIQGSFLADTCTVKSCFTRKDKHQHFLTDWGARGTPIFFDLGPKISLGAPGWIWVCYRRRQSYESDMTGCTMFWRWFTNLSIWSDDLYIIYNRHHGDQKHLFPLMGCTVGITEITFSQFLQHFSVLFFYVFFFYFFFQFVILLPFRYFPRFFFLSRNNLENSVYIVVGCFIEHYVELFILQW